MDARRVGSRQRGGRRSSARLLIVVHCERDAGGVIRLIAARKATRKEATFGRGDHRKAMASEAGVPQQSLINRYLRDCLAQSRRIEIKWPSAAPQLTRAARRRAAP